VTVRFGRDQTSDLRLKEGKTRSWIWTFVAATFTLFANRTSRAADILAQWLGEAYLAFAIPSGPWGGLGWT
jgi:hypothetical protein